MSDLELDGRIDRIKSSIARINALMAEIKGMQRLDGDSSDIKKEAYSGHCIDVNKPKVSSNLRVHDISAQTLIDNIAFFKRTRV